MAEATYSIQWQLHIFRTLLPSNGRHIKVFFHSFLCSPPFYFFLFYYTLLRVGLGDFFQTWKDSSQGILGKSYFKLKGIVTAVAKDTFNNCNQKQLQKALHFSLFIIYLQVCANLHSQSVCRLPPCQLKLNKILIEVQKYLQGIATFLPISKDLHPEKYWHFPS